MTSVGVRPVAARWLGGAVLAALSGCDPQPGDEPGGTPSAVPASVSAIASASPSAVTLVASTGMDGPRGADFDLIVGGRNVEVAADGKVSLRERIGPAQTAFRFVAAGPVGQLP